jgi:valyl-tRNA synthetase
VLDGRVTLVPDKFVGTYRHWMENVQDWCISRQLWWGHRIPVWYGPAGEVIVAPNEAEALRIAKSKGVTGHLTQDPDVLDTWFSSWLWPIAIFDTSVFTKDSDGKYPTGNADLNAFYPTATLVTAPEILFFWVARMIMAGLRYRGQVPFRHVYLTGIVRDKQGRKMSKSLGNSPEPLELMAKYSTDGVRVGMLFSSPAGNDLLFDESLCEQGRNFSNKIWNALRLVAGWGTSLSDAKPTPVQRLTQRWMDARIAQVSAELAQQLDAFRLSEALMTIYKLIWDDFCAWYLELLKPTMTDGQAEPLPRDVFEGAVRSFEQLMVLLHPFMPFLTEEIWHTLAPRAEGASIGRASLPTEKASDAAALITEQMALVRQLATELRALRNSRSLSMREPLPLVIKTSDREFFEAYLPLIRRFAGLGEWTYSDAAPAGSATLMLKAHEIFAVLPAGDTSAERARLTEEINYAEGFLQSVSGKLSNEKFVANAKPDVLAREQQKRADAEAKLAALRASLASLG